eukprot:199401_1
MAAPANFGMKMPPQMKNPMKQPKKAGTIEKVSNLNHAIKTIRVLNRSDESTISDQAFGANTKPNSAKFIMSDADEELLILLEFKEDIDLESISIHAAIKKEDDDEDEDADASAPKQIFIYKIDSLNKDFEDALGMKPDVKFMCDAKKLRSKGGQVIKLKKKAKLSIAFGKINCLMVYIASNQDDTDQTYISGIQFQGNSSAKTDMSRWNDVKCKS